MKFLVIGLGSMGKRRVRNLLALNIDKKDIYGYDIRDDRKNEAKEKYGINIVNSIDIKIDACIISTPPNLHMKYAYIMNDRKIPTFIEASVVDSEKILNLAKNSKTLFAPSATMRFFPMPKLVKRLVKENKIGKILNINYQTGQYLPNWHPWEDIKDFYVSNPNTGGCREIIPFELTWLNDIFGYPEVLSCIRDNLEIENIEDIYHFVLKYPNNILANITIEVLSRQVSRELRILGTNGTIKYSADTNLLECFSKDYEKFDLDIGTKESGYINPEEPYIEEIRNFIDAIDGKRDFVNTLEDDYNTLQILYKLEKISKGLKLQN